MRHVAQSDFKRQLHGVPNGKGLFLKGMGRCANAELYLLSQRGHAIHGSYGKRLGRPVSHGCVRLNPANAAKLYSVVASQGVTNTKVIVTGRIK
jgi:lipoprotein-anchoring transpeptidase ErfK/SrfK